MSLILARALNARGRGKRLTAREIGSNERPPLRSVLTNKTDDNIVLLLGPRAFDGCHLGPLPRLLLPRAVRKHVTFVLIHGLHTHNAREWDTSARKRILSRGARVPACQSYRGRPAARSTPHVAKGGRRTSRAGRPAGLRRGVRTTQPGNRVQVAAYSTSWPSPRRARSSCCRQPSPPAGTGGRGNSNARPKNHARLVSFFSAK